MLVWFFLLLDYHIHPQSANLPGMVFFNLPAYFSAQTIQAGKKRKVIDAVAIKLAEISKGNDVNAIKEGIAALDKAATEFVARRMDGNIKKALAGHNVDEF